MSDMIWLGMIGVLILYVIYIYNTLIKLKNEYHTMFSQIDVQLHRRHDLVPNLVEVAKGYLTHERETLEEVTKARDQAISCLNDVKNDPNNMLLLQSLESVESNLSSLLGQLRVTVEAYPELKANENMQQLSEELTSTENRISFARQAYNDSVQRFNTFKQLVPNNIFAALCGFKENAALFELQDRNTESKSPTVSF